MIPAVLSMVGVALIPCGQSHMSSFFGTVNVSNVRLQITVPVSASSPKRWLELPATKASIFTPCAVVMLLATTGTVRAVSDLGSFFSGTFHFNDSPDTFWSESWFSAKAHPLVSGYSPTVGHP